ncbi:MAG: hypothetical protein KI792_04100 [Alphaproteobacteria bacterium]|nr:hypothetical protein [Alphaproteobacteria bacterium SS10]
MPRGSEVKAKFEALIAAQDKVLEDMGAEQTATLEAAKEQRAPTVAAIRKLAAARITAPNSPDLTSFNAPASDDQPALDLPGLVTSIRTDIAEATAGYEELKAHDRGRDLATITAERDEAQAHAKAANGLLTRNEKITQPLLDMNKKLEADGKPLIGPDTEDDYAGKQRWRYVSDPSYRAVRKAIAEHKELFDQAPKSDTPTASGNPFRDVELHGELSAGATRANSAVEKLQLELDAATLRGRMLGEDQIAEKLREAIGQRAHDTKYAEQIAGTFPKSGVTETLAGSVKADALETIAVDIGSQMDGIQATRKKLSDPLRKLGRARSRNVRVDVEDIAYKVTGQLGYQGVRAKNASRIREGIGNHRIDNGPDTTMMYAALMVVILSSNDSDPALAAQQLSIGEDVASQAGIDLTDLKPDLSGLEGTIAEAGVDIADFNLTGVDAGDFHVDIGSGVGSVDVSTPSVDVSVPSIDVSIPTSTFDAGGGGMGF